MSPPSRSLVLGLCCVALVCFAREVRADDENGRPDGGYDGGVARDAGDPDGGDGDGRLGGPDGGGNPQIPDGGDGDGRPPGFDAGVRPGDGDAGAGAGVVTDAGADAGAGTDGGVDPPDAGGGEPPPVGCGCASTGALDAVVFLAALALARRRRRT